MKSRNPIVDVMKGIGIILMLIGHIPPGERAFHVIYSFHMPLFFIVAGVFAHTDQYGLKDLKKDARRLLLPVLVTMLFIIALSPLHFYTDKNFDNVIVQMLSLVWAGDALPTRWGTLTLDAMWFLMALFWVRLVFGKLGVLVKRYVVKGQEEFLLMCCLLLSFGAIVLHRIIPYVPWGLLKGISALQFYAVGWYIHRHHPHKIVFVVFVICWLLALRFGALDMVHYEYRCYPLDVLGAVGATWLIYLVSKFIVNYASRCSILLRWFGFNSLLILCVNTLDRKTYLVRAVKGFLGFHFDGVYSILFHYSVEMLLVFAILLLPFLKNVYGAKRLKEI